MSLRIRYGCVSPGLNHDDVRPDLRKEVSKEKQMKSPRFILLLGGGDLPELCHNGLPDAITGMSKRSKMKISRFVALVGGSFLREL